MDENNVEFLKYQISLCHAILDEAGIPKLDDITTEAHRLIRRIATATEQLSAASHNGLRFAKKYEAVMRTNAELQEKIYKARDDLK